MYLLVDYREQDFIKKLSEFTFIENDVLKTITINNKDIHFKITNLIVGDFIIKESLEDDNSIKIVIERKSIQDLNSSIKDNRFREQKNRLLESIGDPLKICYLIEGNDKKMPKNILNGALLNLVFKHKYKLIQSTDKLDSFDKIITIYKKFSLNEFTISEVVKNVQMIKKGENIKNNKFINQLCLINGVSEKIASILIEWLETTHKVTNIKLFIDLYNSIKDENEKEKLFSDIKIPCRLTTSSLKVPCRLTTSSLKVPCRLTTSSLKVPCRLTTPPSSRKLGKVLSKKIYEYFCI